MTEGPVFGSVDRFEGLGVFFDTYDNERAHVSLPCDTESGKHRVDEVLVQRHTFPYVMAMLGDGMKSYDNNKDGSDTELAGCEVS